MEESVNELEEMTKKEKLSPSTKGIIKIMSSDVEKLGGLERILLEYMKTQCALIQSESLLLSKWLFKTKTISSHRMLVYNKKGVFSCLLSFFLDLLSNLSSLSIFHPNILFRIVRPSNKKF
jgi:hypothetical protein